MSASAASGSALRVTVEPGQSSFFAGEYFFCKITFTNTATPQPSHSIEHGSSEADSAVPSQWSATAASKGGSNASSSSINGGGNTPAVATADSKSSTGGRSSSDDTVASNLASATQRLSLQQSSQNRKPSPLSSLTTSSGPGQHKPPPIETRGALSHSKSKSLHDVRLSTSAVPTPTFSQTGGSSHPTRKRKGLVGRALNTKTSETPVAAAAVEENSGDAIENARSIRKISHGKSISVAHIASADAGEIQRGQTPPPRSIPPRSSMTSPAPTSRPGAASGVVARASEIDGAQEAEVTGEDGDRVQKVAKQHPRILSRVRNKVHMPHARKKSVIQTQAEDLTEAFALEMGMLAEDSTAADASAKVPDRFGRPGAPVATAYDDGSRTPTESESGLDDTSFISNSSKSGFYGVGSNDTMESVVREDLSERIVGRAGKNANRQGPLALNRRLSVQSQRNLLSPTSMSSSSAHFPTPLQRQPSTNSSQGDLIAGATSTSEPGSGTASPFFPAPAHTQVTQGTEVILWSYAQFSGMFSIDESLIKPFDFELVKYRIAQGTIVSAASGVAAPGGRSEMALKASNKSSGRIIGGGELLALGRAGKGELQLEAELRMGTATGTHAGDGAEEEAEAMQRAISGGGSGAGDGWSAYLRNRLTLGLAGGDSAARKAKHKRTGSTLVDTSQKTILAKSIPTFSTPPSILCVDLALEPGQSRSYNFRLPLPPDLPPSYLGKAISFTYTLAIGTNRLEMLDSNGRSASRTAQQKSRLIQIPIRVYNHVSVTGARPFWDLLNPVICVRDGAVITSADTDDDEPMDAPPATPIETAGHASSAEIAKKSRDESSHANLVSYAKELLASCATPKATGGVAAQLNGSALSSDDAGPLFEEANAINGLQVSQPPGGRRMLRRRSSVMSAASRGADEDTIDTCMEAVEVLSRTSPKVSYDIAKDGQIAAILTLVKSKYRLGDTLSGVVTINSKGSYARIVRVAVHLESHEEIQPDVATMASSRSLKMTKRVVTSSHESTLDAGQVSFALPIPSGATPDFTTSGVKLLWTVRLSLLTLASVKPPPLPKASENDKYALKPNPIIYAKKLPPPHLVPGTPDGFALYHQSLRALPALSGPLPSFTPDESFQTYLASKGIGTESKLEIVECSVPLAVLPNSTRFRTSSVRFAA